MRRLVYAHGVPTHPNTYDVCVPEKVGSWAQKEMGRHDVRPCGHVPCEHHLSSTQITATNATLLDTTSTSIGEKTDQETPPELAFHGGTPVHHPYYGDFPWNKPASYVWKPPNGQTLANFGNLTPALGLSEAHVQHVISWGAAIQPPWRRPNPSRWFWVHLHCWSNKAKIKSKHIKGLCPEQHSLRYAMIRVCVFNEPKNLNRSSWDHNLWYVPKCFESASCLLIYPLNLSIHPSKSMEAYGSRSIYPSINPSTCPFIHLSIYLYASNSIGVYPHILIHRNRSI